MNPSNQKNVFGESLESCCHNPKTGFFRDGYCRTDETDYGKHIICAEMTREFLTFSKNMGNDLSTPRPEFNFPGLKAGDRWCLCAIRWKEAYEADVAPEVILEACHENALEIVPLEILLKYSIKTIH